MHQAPPNPIGITVSNSHISTQRKITLGSVIGAHYFKPQSIATTDWSKSPSLRKSFVTLCDEIRAAKMTPVISIKPTCTSLGIDQAVYTDIIATCKPALVIFENPTESVPRSVYIDHLNALTEIAHAHNAECTHAPIDASDLVVFLHETNPEIVDILDPTERLILTDEYSNQRDELRKKIQLQLDSITHSKVDFSNFGWDSQHATHIEAIAQFLQSYTSKHPISTKIGRPVDTFRAEKLTQAILKLEMPYTIWYFSVEGPSGYSLVDPSGKLGTIPSAFTQFMRRYFTISHS